MVECCFVGTMYCKFRKKRYKICDIFDILVVIRAQKQKHLECTHAFILSCKQSIGICLVLGPLYLQLLFREVELVVERVRLLVVAPNIENCRMNE